MKKKLRKKRVKNVFSLHISPVSTPHELHVRIEQRKLQREMTSLLSPVMFIVLLALAAAPAFSVTIADLALTPAACAVLRSTIGATIPCVCKLNTGELQNPVACYPNCCPKTATYEGDWCHKENELQWSVYDQLKCVEAPPKEFIDDTPNCFYANTAPYITSVVPAGGETVFTFQLSALSTCSNLYVSKCHDRREGLTDFRLNTSTTALHEDLCWLKCGPTPYEPCSASSCWAHRGKTASVVNTWTVPRQLPPGDYALVCESLVSAAAVSKTLYQFAYASSFFRIL